MTEHHSLPDLSLEKGFWKAGIKYVGGIDEAGRGAWAGPVFAAVVVLSEKGENTQMLGHVRDSKQMTARQRQKWRSIILDSCLTWAVGSASNREIDAMGIVPATRRAVGRALKSLETIPESLLLDYLTLPDVPIKQKAIIHGDQRVLSIAAASILAKTERDAYMERMDLKYPGYSFCQNKGYGTAIHRLALKRLGTCNIHRFTFKPVMEYEKRCRGESD